MNQDTKKNEMTELKKKVKAFWECIACGVLGDNNEKCHNCGMEGDIPNCPFCDSCEFELHKTLTSCRVACGNCGARGAEWEYLQDALSAWNTRATTDHDELRAQLKAAEERNKVLENTAEFYKNYIKDLGSQTDSCTYSATKDICPECRCGKQALTT